jgi:hypothetical protein
MRNQSADIERAVKDKVGQAGNEKTKNEFNVAFESAAKYNAKDHASEVEQANRNNRKQGVPQFTRRGIA